MDGKYILAVLTLGYILIPGASFWFYAFAMVIVGLGELAGTSRRRLEKSEKNLIVQLEERTAQLQTANIELETILDDLRVANREAWREREAADAANKAKSEFLANMSHEIRTPMNAILGFAEILKSEVKSNKQVKYVDTITSSGQTLLALINDILDLSRIEAGKVELQYEPVHLPTIIDEVGNMFATRAGEKDLEFAVHIDPNLPESLFMDGLRIRQILLNLLGNAFKFTGSGFVRLSVDCERTEQDAARLVPDTVNVILTIEDSGIGIADDQQDVIFKAFQQQQGQAAATFGGTGLGLAITRSLVQLMKGDISVQSEVDNGSCFTVTLRNVKVTSVTIDKSIDFSPDVNDVRFEKTSILVSDELKLNRELLMEYLGDSDIQFIEAGNGKEAIELSQQHRPGAILMDIKMPVMNGFQATRVLKSHHWLSKIPVILITSSALSDEHDELKNSGCDGWLNKPLDKADLVIELMNFLPYFTVEQPDSEVPKHSAEAAAALSPEAREKLPELLSILKSDTFTKRWQDVSRTLILDEVEAFSGELNKLDQTYETQLLSIWAEGLFMDAHSFNPGKIRSTLGTFPMLINRIERLSN